MTSDFQRNLNNCSSEQSCTKEGQACVRSRVSDVRGESQRSKSIARYCLTMTDAARDSCEPQRRQRTGAGVDETSTQNPREGFETVELEREFW